MSDNNASILNGLFVDALSNNEGLEKLAEVGGAYIQKILRETSFARQILPPVNVTRSDVTRSVTNDGFVKIVDIEPDSKAMAMNFQGEPDGRYVVGKRYAVPFYRIASEDFSKDETELLAYDYPITKVIEENSVKDIQGIEDAGFLANVDAGILSNDMWVNYIGSTPDLSKGALKVLINLIENQRLKAETFLMSTTTWNDILEFDHTVLGDDLIEKVTIDGYTYATFLGRKVITSIKTSMFFKNAAYVPGGTVTTLTTTGAVASTKTFSFSGANLVPIGRGDSIVISGGHENNGLTVTVASVGANSIVVNEAISNSSLAETFTVTAASLKVVYAFTAPRFLGQFYILNQTKFVIKKDFNIISWRAWEDIAIGIGNLNAAAAVTLGT
jgi:hypothetical protein